MSHPVPADSLKPHLAPATWAALIVGGFFVGFFALFAFWVTKEASRVKQQRAADRMVNSAVTGDMIWIPPGSFTMGGMGEQARPDELPLHDVKIDGFWIDQTEVTNEEFGRFVEATGYRTTAERPRKVASTPELPPEMDGKASSLCLRPLQPSEKESDLSHPWHLVVGADWRHPAGPESNLQGLEKHPVVQVSYEDAAAYATWAGKRLPTESEWEFSARGGLIAQALIWGSEMKPEGRWMANTWQGQLAGAGDGGDGFAATAPVKSFRANGYGLYDMAGNVREWTGDWYRPDSYAMIARNPARVARKNPHGPTDSFDPDEPTVWKKVTRGGSFLSGEADSHGYRPSARMKSAPGTSSQDTGFRCVKDAAL